MSTLNLIAIKNDSGQEIDAHFSLEVVGGKVTLIFATKVGGANSSFKKNQDYDAGFRLLLARLALRGEIIQDAVVDSWMTRKANLPHGQRRLRLGGNYSFPITMSHVDDIDKLRKVLSAAQKPIGQSPGSKGGNGQKTIRLYIGINAVGVDLSVLGRELAEPPQSAVVSEADIAGAANVADVDKRFDPGSIEDARSRILASIVQRQGQPAFRRELLSAYGGKCAITQCELEEVLEAAHVYPFRGSVTNVVQNGLLLRSDIHTLFDRGLIAVDTADWSILIHEKLVSTCYSVLSGRKLSLPLNHQMHPNTDALDRHRADSGL